MTENNKVKFKKKKGRALTWHCETGTSKSVSDLTIRHKNCVFVGCLPNETPFGKN